MAENMKEGQIYCDAFEAFDAVLRESTPEMVEGWKKWVHQWESRQHKDGTESPFEVKEKGSCRKRSYCTAGREQKSSRRTHQVVANPTDAKTVDILKRWTALLRHIQGFHKLQWTYMPNLHRFLTATQHAIWDTEPEWNAEAVWLFMSSDILDATKHVKVCTVGLPAMEESLWGQGILQQINVKIHKAKIHYHYVWNTLKRLRGDRPWKKELAVLEDSNVCALTEEEAEQRLAVHNYKEIMEEGGVAHSGHLAVHVWAEQVDAQVGTVKYELLEGLRVFAHKQEDREITTSNKLIEKWAGIWLKGCVYLAREMASGMDIVVPLDDDNMGEEGEEGEEEGPPDYEDESDDKTTLFWAGRRNGAGCRDGGLGLGRVEKPVQGVVMAGRLAGVDAVTKGLGRVEKPVQGVTMAGWCFSPEMPMMAEVV
ncbi:hypothetical protein DFH08DRAFT_801209 [Mycena albidolilacea]|uniref:Uncharacterized protein n=1 Tax=Mycena albidolilacea TaxID=1033008 RepID=A0AAD7AHX3_9AGAR|nr:hypothetical protein DFH08DRAFT_801209 [Mycena albidolilacea]